MSMEGVGIRPGENPKWKIFRERLLKREPSIFRMLNAGEVSIKWEEDEKGDPMCIKVYKTDGTLIFFEDVKVFSRPVRLFR